jgi:hypothetical protein
MKSESAKADFIVEKAYPDRGGNGEVRPQQRVIAL